MSTILQVDNLNQTTTESDLTDLFNRIGLVLSVSIPVDARTGVRGKFGYVSMTGEGAKAAIQALHGTVYHDRQLSISEKGGSE
jgi:RNA recognition motif-containing protein